MNFLFLFVRNWSLMRWLLSWPLSRLKYTIVFSTTNAQNNLKEMERRYEGGCCQRIKYIYFSIPISPTVLHGRRCLVWLFNCHTSYLTTIVQLLNAVSNENLQSSVWLRVIKIHSGFIFHQSKCTKTNICERCERVENFQFHWTNYFIFESNGMFIALQNKKMLS